MSFRLKIALRDADWLTPRRARAYPRLLMALQAVALIALLASARDGLDYRGEPIGTDFISFWTAARMAISGAAVAVYNPAAHHAAEQIFATKIDWYAFFYPPIYLLYLLPFGPLPYFPSLAAWVGTTLAAYTLTLRRIAPEVGLPPILAFVLTLVGHGQNAFLTTSLFTGGALLLEQNPFAAGLVLGALCYKPQLAVLVPLALAAAGRGRALAGFMVCVAGLALVSGLAFGWEAWSAFFKESAVARHVMEAGYVDPGKFQSVFSALRLWGAPAPFAYGTQALVSLATVAVLIRAVRRTRDTRLQMAVTAVAGLMATPFMLDYDLALMALPLAVVFSASRAQGAEGSGFLPYEKTALFAAYALPVVARSLAIHAALPLTPLVLALLLAALSRRAEREA